MSVGFYFNSILVISHTFKQWFFKKSQINDNFTNFERKKKSYPHITIIHVKYIWEFFGNFHMTHSRGVMLEV